jgi:hypothetical protein
VRNQIGEKGLAIPGNITPEIKGLNWQTNVSAAVEVKSLSPALANVVQTLGEAGQALHDIINACSDMPRLDDAATHEGRISDSDRSSLAPANRQRQLHRVSWNGWPM